MKKIRRLSLNGLEETCTLLNDSAQAAIMGGGDPFKIKGGTLTEVNGGVQYVGDDGKTCFFEDCSLSSASPTGTAYQWGGTIHIDEKWTTFDINDFAHEYGHRLQEQEMGTFLYTFYVGARSALDVAWGDFLDWLGVSHKDHSERSYEKDASKRGEEYLKQYMKDPSTEEE